MEDTQQPQKSAFKKLSTKNVVGLLALLAFGVVVSLGVLVSQRQRIIQESVSPFDPDSQPSAAEVVSQTCSLLVSPLNRPSPSPSPSASPSPTPTASPPCDDHMCPCHATVSCDQLYFFMSHSHDGGDAIVYQNDVEFARFTFSGNPNAAQSYTWAWVSGPPAAGSRVRVEVWDGRTQKFRNVFNGVMPSCAGGGGPQTSPSAPPRGGGGGGGGGR